MVEAADRNRFDVSIKYYAYRHRKSTIKCKVDGCSKFVRSLGYCPKHYWRFKKYGDPLFLRIDREKSNVNKLTKFELGYVTGLIEGEGTISLSYHGHSSDYRRRRRWDVYVKISNTDKHILENVQLIVGAGSLLLHDRKINRPRSKPEYTWSLTQHSDIKKLLEQIKPFLIVKNKNAELALKYIEIRQKICREGYRNGYHAKDEYKIFEEFSKIIERGPENQKIKPLEVS